MLFKIQIFRGFDKNQSYGIFSMYIYWDTHLNWTTSKIW